MKSLYSTSCHCICNSSFGTFNWPWYCPRSVFSIICKNADLDIQRKYWSFLIIILVIAFILSLLMAARMMLQYAKPIDEVTKTAIRIAKEIFLREYQTTESEYDNELSIAINKIARNMQEMSSCGQMEKERLNTLVESMGSGLLMFGREGSVNLVNGVFRETFGFTNEEIIGKTSKYDWFT